MSDTPTFTPVPTARARRDGWTPTRQTAFLEALATLGLVSAAAKSVGMSRKSAYALRLRPGAGSFAAAWDAAVTEGRDEAFGLAFDFAINGTPVPVFRRGVQIGERRCFDHRLLLTALRTNMSGSGSDLVEEMFRPKPKRDAPLPSLP